MVDVKREDLLTGERNGIKRFSLHLTEDENHEDEYVSLDKVKDFLVIKEEPDWSQSPELQDTTEPPCLHDSVNTTGHSYPLGPHDTTEPSHVKSEDLEDNSVSLPFKIVLVKSEHDEEEEEVEPDWTNRAGTPTESSEASGAEDWRAADSVAATTNVNDIPNSCANAAVYTNEACSNVKETSTADAAIASAAFACPHCHRPFVHRQSLQRHLRRYNSSLSTPPSCTLSQRQGTDPAAGERLHQCDVCGKCVKYRHNLKTHMRVHTGERRHACEECGRRFKHRQNLVTHARIHTGERPFVCHVCGAGARHQNNLKVHMLVHTGEAPHICDTCGKRFKRKTHLQAHAATHSGERAFACQVCGKRFNRKSHLRTHAAAHTGEKPHACDVCGKRFQRRTHLNTHSSVHTGERKFSCSVCGRGFTQQGSLNRHMRFHAPLNGC